MPQNLTLPIKMLIVGAIVKNNITCKRMYGNPKTWIWQPLWPKTFQNHHIELYLLLYNISEGSYTPKKPVTMKLSKIRGKTAENSKNRRIQLKYREGGFGNTFIRFPALEYGILKKKIIILDPIEKKLVAPPKAMAAILDFGLWSPKATPAIVLPVHSVLYNP